MVKARSAHQPLTHPPHPLTSGLVPLRPQEPPSRPGAPHPWDHTMDTNSGVASLNLVRMGTVLPHKSGCPWGHVSGRWWGKSYPLPSPGQRPAHLG